MKDKIVLNMFIDAFGWELLNENSFLDDIVKQRHKLQSVFGYSSACIPSILMGKKPSDHGFWSSFYYSPKTSPFKNLKPLAILPKFIANRSRVRHLINRSAKRLMNWKGYLSFYNFPFQYIGLFDYKESVNFYETGSTECPTIFDYLQEKSVPYFSFNQDMDEEHQFTLLNEHLANEDIEFAYLSMGKVDGLAHIHDRHSEVLKNQIKTYESWIRYSYELAQKNYREVVLNIFSDHDMAPVKKTINVMEIIDDTGLKFNKDYVAVFDSTMARFWFLNDSAKEKITAALGSLEEGRLLTDKELQILGSYYPDGRYGEFIFIVDEGVLIVPSFMGEKAISGMHGYLPNTKHSYSMCLTNHEYNGRLTCITDVYQLMKDCV